MTGEIMDAILKEAKKFFEDTGSSVMFKTDFKLENIPTYKMPLLLIEVMDGIESRQFLGGVTSMDWNFAFNAYNYQPDANVDDLSGYSTSLINFLDDVRRHFTIGAWLTAGMPQIEKDYGFRFTLTGIQAAPALDADGLLFGKQFYIESMAIDEATNSIQPSSGVLENVVQVGSDQVNEEHVGYTATINLFINMANQQVTIPANTLVKSISLLPVQGAPNIKIGTTAGGAQILADTLINGFVQMANPFYCAVETILYSTMTGDGLVNTRIDVQRDYFVNQ